MSGYNPGFNLSGAAIVLPTTLADLKARVARENNEVVQTIGRSSVGDRAGGLFYWDNRSFATDNANGLPQPDDALIVAPSSASTGASGAWVRIWDGINLDLSWFGVKGDGSTNNQPLIQAVLNRADIKNMTLKFPPGVVIINSALTVYSSRGLVFDGQNATELRLVSSTVGASIFQHNQDSNPYAGISAATVHIYRAFKLLQATGATFQKVLQPDPSTPVSLFEKLVVEDCRILCTGYAFYLPGISYSIAPRFERIRCTGGGFFWISASNSELHATSNMVFTDIRHHSLSYNAVGPMMYLENVRGTRIESVILEGNYNPLESGAPTGLATTLHLKNCGPAGPTRIENLWIERAGTYTTTGNYDVVVEQNLGGPRGGMAVYFSGVHSGLAPWNIKGNIYDPLSGTNSNDSLLVVLEGVYGPSLKDQFITEGNAFVQIKNCNLRDTKNTPTQILNAQKTNVFIRDSVGVGLSYLPRIITRTPAQLVYKYTGGWLENRYSKGFWANTNAGTAPGVRYVQHDPVYGHTVVYRFGAGIIPITANPAVTRYIGQRLFCQGDIRVPHMITAGQTFTFAIPRFPFFDIDSEYSITYQEFVDAFSDNGGWLGLRGYGTPTVANRDIDQISYSGVVGGNPKWFQFKSLAISMGDYLEVESRIDTMDCYFERYYGLPIGTVVVGDICRVSTINSNYASSAYSSINPLYVSHFICSQSGTSRTINITGSINSGSTQLTVSDVTELLPGDYINIAGVTGTKRVMSIDWGVGGTGAVTLNSTSNATVSGAAITNANPVWVKVLTGFPREGSGSPVGSITPDEKGQEYINTSATPRTVWRAVGTTSADWIQIG